MRSRVRAPQCLFKMLPNKTVYYNLLQIHGIGANSATRILAKLGISKYTLVSDLLPSSLDQLNHVLANLRNLTQSVSSNSSKSSFSPIESNLDTLYHSHLVRLYRIKSYRGIRLSLGYPVRGQRTRSNANSAKALRSLVSSLVS